MSEAQFNLGLCYLFGRGVSEDLIKGLALCGKAEEQGYAVALYLHGLRCYTAESPGPVKR